MPTRRLLLTLLAVAAIASACTALPAHATGNLVDLQVVDRSRGDVLSTWRHRGTSWVAGRPGDRYALRLSNRTGGRVLVVLSVDGVNVVSGETAATGQTGYVLGPWASAEITGWRKSYSEAAAFYFTALPDSYAARTDRPDNVGVIGAAIFRERVVAAGAAAVRIAAAGGERPPRQCDPRREAERRAQGAGAAADASSERAANAPAPRRRRCATASRWPRRRSSAPATASANTRRRRRPTFERAGAQPNEIVQVRYDSYANLVAAGVIGRPQPPALPQPFPGSCPIRAEAAARLASPHRTRGEWHGSRAQGQARAGHRRQPRHRQGGGPGPGARRRRRGAPRARPRAPRRGGGRAERGLRRPGGRRSSPTPATTRRWSAPWPRPRARSAAASTSWSTPPPSRAATRRRRSSPSSRPTSSSARSTSRSMGYVRTAREVAPQMQARGWGRIVNISGLAARAERQHHRQHPQRRGRGPDQEPRRRARAERHQRHRRPSRPDPHRAHRGAGVGAGRGAGRAAKRRSCSAWPRATRSAAWSMRPRSPTWSPSSPRRNRWRSTATRSPPAAACRGPSTTEAGRAAACRRSDWRSGSAVPRGRAPELRLRRPARRRRGVGAPGAQRVAFEPELDGLHAADAQGRALDPAVEDERRRGAAGHRQRRPRRPGSAG